jgi:hypothetical protein
VLWLWKQQLQPKKSKFLFSFVSERRIKKS